MRYPVSVNRFIRCRDASKGCWNETEWTTRLKPTQKRFTKAIEILPDAVRRAASTGLIVCTIRQEGIERG